MDPTARKPALKFVYTQWLFLRLLGVIYLIAFVSLSTQLDGLLGSAGILPAANFMKELAAALPSVDRYAAFPTWFWFGASDSSLHAVCALGMLASALVMLDVISAPALICAWTCYLSFMTVGQDFLSFQWDSLLLEVGFLAIFLEHWRIISPLWQRRPLPGQTSKESLAVLWLLRWLLFRLMFLSGAVKLLSHDEAWKALTALNYHYQTQPLPTPLAWYAALLPAWFQQLSVACVFLFELAVPWLMLGTRKFRYVACAFTVFLQVVILLTGNYTFFNLLTITLCVTLLDDSCFQHARPVQRLFQLWVTKPSMVVVQSGPAKLTALWSKRIAVAALVFMVVVISGAQLMDASLSIDPFFGADRALRQAARPFHVVNTYGLFAVMTLSRPEITVQGSDDNINWKDYVFKYKPGPLNRALPVVAPLQPRLDWQMWFAALGPPARSPWFFNFVERLLTGSKPVLALLEVNPFGGHPPKYVRAIISDYRFTTPQEKANTGNWWVAAPPAVFIPPMSLNNVAGEDNPD